MALNMRDALNFDEGYDKGHTDGRRAAKIDIARRMKAMGMPGGQILQATGLSLNEIDAL